MAWLGVGVFVAKCGWTLNCDGVTLPGDSSEHAAGPSSEPPLPLNTGGSPEGNSSESLHQARGCEQRLLQEPLESGRGAENQQQTAAAVGKAFITVPISRSAHSPRFGLDCRRVR